MEFNNVSQFQAIQYAKNYRGAKTSLQHSVYWAVGQILNGNADGLYQIMLAAGMLSSNAGVMTTLADGRQLWKYLTTSQEDGGLGLTGIVRWDKKTSNFKMVQKWQEKAGQLDYAIVIKTLASTRWDELGQVKAEHAFDLEKAIVALVKKAANHGCTEAEIATAFATATGRTAISAN